MYITDVVLEKNVLKQVQQRISSSICYLVLFALSILISGAFIVFCLINKVSSFDTYLFGAFGILIPFFWIFIALKEYKTYKIAKQQILENGSYTFTTPTEVNAEHKHNSSTILNIVCVVLVFACFVATIVSQVLNYDITTLYSVVMTFVLTIFMCYQTTTGLINDKMFRTVIWGQDNNK